MLQLVIISFLRLVDDVCQMEILPEWRGIPIHHFWHKTISECIFLRNNMDISYYPRTCTCMSVYYLVHGSVFYGRPARDNLKIREFGLLMMMQAGQWKGIKSKWKKIKSQLWLTSSLATLPYQVHISYHWQLLCRSNLKSASTYCC